MELEIWHLWLFLSVSLFVLEIFISTFVSVCFGLGALTAGIIAFTGLDTSLQLLMFACISILSLFVIKPFIKKHMISRSYQPMTEHQPIVGQEAYVMEEINPSKNVGRVIISGVTWKAKTEFGETIPKGSFVKILGKDSVTLTVKGL